MGADATAVFASTNAETGFISEGMSSVPHGQDFDQCWALRRPTLLLAATKVYVLDDGGCACALVLPLAGLHLKEDRVERTVELTSGAGLLDPATSAAAAAEPKGRAVRLHARLRFTGWVSWLPSLRDAIGANNGA
mmetsp:Transcript_21657/g.70009  ORF Transcript_21657/g.70009 Transcript_21657/m.70009 type:complete len:135 (+) Transcript_21657:1-405(+)